ncbi:GvpL/GvpF family gas vesicle protein [Desulfosporosinus nitroreducens]|uniref:GvpL/GvpF family gas vesicle protein n=1 Tax=Desulfosporosinus nitroreducens TaxID=2018668 RepID=UPI0025A9C0F8|nr:GvpL/GvpF family gas vesicle protein [Desulfosporosinus nitroreducens]
MKLPYLLGFVRNCVDLPSEPPLFTRLTTVGKHSVIWCKSPMETFTTKQDFLLAMLQWFEKIQHLELTVLPIQSGVSVLNEGYLEGLLRIYKRELDLCFDKVEGCSEYCLTIIQRDQGYAHLSYASLRENVSSGKEYLDRVRMWHQMMEREVLQAREVILNFCLRLTPWIKDCWSETPQTQGEGINLSFLVPNACQQEFINELKLLLAEVNVTDKWTGPWLPFHFSSFTLKPERFLIHESLNWGKGRVTS